MSVLELLRGSCKVRLYSEMFAAVYVSNVCFVFVTYRQAYLNYSLSVSDVICSFGALGHLRLFVIVKFVSTYMQHLVKSVTL
jgi:hypothetical protein